MVGYTPPRAPLFVPADRPERFDKAALSGADAVILDLEDAVADDAKDRARAALRCDFTDLPVIVRVNQIGALWHEADLAALRSHPFAAIMLPKAESRAAIEAMSATLPGLPVVALIESA
ncbi:MAG: aldolase/citrate lyase family protein, partial [Paracoccus sp. (in: a-proteobacteria)]